MVAFPKVGFTFKLKSEVCSGFLSVRMIVSRIIESGERLTKEQVLRFYGLGAGDLVTENTLARLSVFSRPRVLFWDFTNSRYRIYPWDEQTAKRIWDRLVPIGQTDPKTVPTVEVKPEDKDKYHKACESYEIRKAQVMVGELKLWSETQPAVNQIPPVTWAEHAKVVTELAALKANLKRHFPSLKFD